MNNFFHIVYWDFIINGLNELKGQKIAIEDLPLALFNTQKGEDFFLHRNNALATEFIYKNYYMVDNGLRFLINDVKVDLDDIVVFDNCNQTIKAMICAELKIILKSPLNIKYRNEKIYLDKYGIKKIKKILNIPTTYRPSTKPYNFF